MDKIRTMKPSAPETSRWASSIINSGVMLDGTNLSSHSGHDLPQPIPEPVFVTSAPPSKTKIIPIVVATANHFKERCKKFTFLT